MSMKGIKRFAQVLSDLQTAKRELIDMGTKELPELYTKGKPTKKENLGATKEQLQDIRLGQLLDQAGNAVKHEFTKITIE